MEAEYQGTFLFATGYKYNKRKVVCFISTQGGGYTYEGKPYKARWKDKNNNFVVKDIPQPFLCSRYFQNLNTVDGHNQSLQFDLRLEKCWVTEDGFFRIATMIFGMVITDCWKGY